MKIMGCMTLSFHEAVKYTSTRSLARTIKVHTKKGDMKEAINSYDDNGRTPLICAIMSKRPERQNPDDIISTLLTAGADVDLCDSLNGMTPLHYAGMIKDERYRQSHTPTVSPGLNVHIT